jgi:hypothetical protein
VKGPQTGGWCNKANVANAETIIILDDGNDLCAQLDKGIATRNALSFEGFIRCAVVDQSATRVEEELSTS